jgi:4-hydroxybenzoate polyprenyltransferase
MGFNRIVDREVDARNPRTKGRELPSGVVGLREAWIFTIFAAVVFVVASFGINFLCGALSVPLLALLLGYSLTKRYTWSSHFVLGLCLGAAPIGVWFALTGSFDWAPILLGAGVTFWTAGFDVYYSLQDEEFDRQNGLRSIPARFGNFRSILLVRVIHAFASLFFVAFGLAAGMGIPFWTGLALVVGILVWEGWILRKGDLSKIDLAFFSLNGYVSILFAVATVIDLWIL